MVYELSHTPFFPSKRPKAGLVSQACHEVAHLHQTGYSGRGCSGTESTRNWIPAVRQPTGPTAGTQSSPQTQPCHTAAALTQTCRQAAVHSPGICYARLRGDRDPAPRTLHPLCPALPGTQGPGQDHCGSLVVVTVLFQRVFLSLNFFEVKHPFSLLSLQTRTPPW